MNLDLQSPVALMIARNDDPWNALAHCEGEVDNDHLSQTSSAAASVRAVSAAAISSRQPSVVTKPTSYGTTDPIYHQNNDGKANATYAASSSATRDSGFEGEVEPDDTLHATLLGTGAWLPSQETYGCLRRHENARIRLQENLPHRVKKPLVILHQVDQSAGAIHKNHLPRPVAASTPTAIDQKCPFQQTSRQHYDMLGLICVMLLTVYLSGCAI